MMDDLIRRKAMAKIKVPSKLPIKEIKCKDVYGREYVIPYTDEPMVEYAPVVRCKDCKYKQGSACEYSAVWVRPNGFCHWGERREEQEDE